MYTTAKTSFQVGQRGGGRGKAVAWEERRGLEEFSATGRPPSFCVMTSSGMTKSWLDWA